MNTNYSIRRGRTEIDIPHQGKILTFVHPAYGPNTYANVGSQIEQAKLRKSTMADLPSLLNTTYTADEPEFTKIKKLMRDSLLWCFTGVLYTPQGVAYIQEDPGIRDDMPFMDESELVKKLEANDHTVRMAPMEYPVGEMKPSDLAKHPLVRALATSEGTENLAEVASKFRYNPRLFALQSVDQPTIRVSALGSVRDLGDGRLYVDGNVRGYDSYGYAFGVQEKTGEASRA